MTELSFSNSSLSTV